MTNQPSVLLLDDGELDNVYRMLGKLGAHVMRLQGNEIGREVPMPRDLLITAGGRTLRGMPELTTAEDASTSPIWICVHNQDFLPMRQRLCEMGVNYLLQNALDEQSRRLFLSQLLRSGAEKRGSLRLHLGGDIQYRARAELHPGRLVELSMDGCQLITEESFEPGTTLTAVLPTSLGGGAELELTGNVLRVAYQEVREGHHKFATVIRFDELDEATREQLASITRGERIGTKITPLAQLHEQPCSELAADTADQDKRGVVRHAYNRGAHVLRKDQKNDGPVLGCDLSLSGVRLSGCTGLEVGSEVSVALFGSAREEPTVIDASVVRTGKDGEAALSFTNMSASQLQSLEKLLSSQPLLDSLDHADPETGRTIVAEVHSTDLSL